MNFKHVILAVCIIFILSITILSISATDNISYSNESSKINFEGIDFVIPMGFGQSKSIEDYGELGSHGKTSFYINEYGGEIVITVVSDWMGMSLDELKKDGAVKSSIKGYEGWNYSEGNLTYFSYLNDDKGIIVGVTNQTRFNEIII